ncbi:hypothetical protein CSQ87_06485 [Bifidobacterium simiarum]|uniref:Uncharacterized protein n=2 Tax=Bifidobacterium simiarum TaxID=2045441 RepID=A0A2M9HEL7_9BIFI|nr:hypothetical protein CSQ87_06485 [Bifidobacterium simiarum]
MESSSHDIVRSRSVPRPIGKSDMPIRTVSVDIEHQYVEITKSKHDQVIEEEGFIMTDSNGYSPNGQIPPQAPQPQQPQQPVAAPYQAPQENRRGGKPKKPFWKKWWFWLIVVLIVIGAIAGGSGNGSGNDGSSPSSSQTSTATKSDTAKQQQSGGTSKTTGKTVELQATATGEGTVMWFKNGSSNTEEFKGQWSKTFTGDEAKELTGLSVTGDVINGGNDQKMTCKVIVNGEQKDAKEATGTTGSAFCTVPLY